VQNSISNTELNILNQIQSSEKFIIKLPKTSAELGIKNKPNFINSKEIVENRIKMFRQEATAKLKKELEEKMKILEDQLQILSISKLDNSFSPYEKSNIMHKKVKSETERKKFKEDWEKKRLEAEEFAKKMIQLQNEIKKKTDEQVKIAEEKMRKEQEEQDLIKKQNLEYEERLRKIELKRQIEESEKKRKLEKEKIVNFLEPLPKKPYLYEKMTSEFHENEKISELEKRKKTIAEKRNIYQPLRKEDFENHEKNYVDLIKKFEAEHQKEREMFHNSKIEEEYVRKIKNLRTSFAKVAIRSSTEAKTRLQDNKNQMKQRVAKMQEYAKTAQEIHPPIISEKKAKEISEKLTKPKRKNSEDRSEILKKLESTIPFSTKKSRKNHSLERKSNEKLNYENEKSEINNKSLVNTGSATGKLKPQIRKIDKSIENEQKGGNSIENLKNEKVDYLAELRKKKIIKPVETIGADELKNYEEVIKNHELSPEIKLLKVKEKVEKLERVARKKEQLVNPKKGGKKFLEVENEISDIYINSIKAKISLLGL